MMLCQFMMSMQAGSYGPMIEGATRFTTGHLQVQHELFHDQPRIEYLVNNAAEIQEKIANLPGIEAVLPRAQSFALLSNEDRSFGGLVVGVDPELEREHSFLPNQIAEDGEYLPSESSALVGSRLARNLGLQLGGELVILGSSPDGNMAAHVAIVDGIFDTGNAVLDRSLVQLPLSTFQRVFDLGEQVHYITAFVDDPLAMGGTVSRVQATLPEATRAIDWTTLVPGIQQSIQIDLISNAVIAAVLMLVIVLSIANSFVMTMFERTREFGMLLAIGIQPGLMFRMLLAEAVLLWIVGVVFGTILSGVLIGSLLQVGIPVPGGEAVADSWFMPDRMYPGVNGYVIFVTPVAIGIGILISAGIAFLRVFRMQVVEALRDRE